MREHLATHGEEHGLGEGVVAVGALPAEVRQREHIHVGDLAYGVGGEVEALSDGGRVAGDDDIRSPEEAFEHLAPLGRLEIEDDGLLVRVEELVATAALDAGLVVEPGAEAADGVAAGPLDLDYAGASRPRSRARRWRRGR